MELRPVWFAGIVCVVLPMASLAEEDAFQFFQEEAKVITASKAEQSISDATSAMTVITADDIARWGVRTLYDALKRVPGFFPSNQSTWPLVGSRGLVADGNDHLLLLVDGHTQNSIVGQGYQQQDLMPNLQDVKRIEIIRGPGSVLWGSNAVFGVINIITKDGSDEPGNKVTVGYGDRDGQTSGNYLYSFKHGEDVSGLVSFSAWQSNGYDRPGGGSGANGSVDFPWGSVQGWPPIDKQQESYDFYAKLKIGDANQLLARMAQTNTVYPWDSVAGRSGSDLSMRKSYLEFQHRTEVNDKFHIDSLVYGDLLLQNRFPDDNSLFTPAPNNGVIQDQSNEELAFGAESTGKIQVTDQNDLTAGAKAVRTHIGPNRDSRFNDFLNVASSTGLPYVGVDSGYDDDLAAYFEDQQKFFEGRTKVFLGSRYDYDDFREKKGVVLPRGGVIQSLDEDWTMKYVLNTGYLRPEAVYSKTVGVIVDQSRGPTQGILTVNQGENTVDHDIQLRWEKNRNNAAITMFYMNITDYISFDANNTPQGYKNLGDVTSKGVELEGRYELWPGRLACYGNYSYAHATLDNNNNPYALTNPVSGQVLNYPQHIWNVGADWSLNRSNTLNVNLNGWAHMPIVLPADQAAYYDQGTTLAGEQYVDLSYHSIGVFRSPIDVTLSVSNLLNNTHALGMVVNNGIWYPEGRDFKVQLSYKW